MSIIPSGTQTNPVLQPQEQRPDREDLRDTQMIAQGSDKRAEPGSLGKLAATHCVQPQHHCVQHDRDLTIPTGSRERSPYTTDRRIGTTRPRTTGPGRIHADPQCYYGEIAGHGTRQVPSVPQEDSQHIHGLIPIGLRTTLGNASVVLVTISKEREVRGSLGQVVGTMEDNQIQTPSSESPPIRVAPPQRETRNPTGGSD